MRSQYRFIILCFVVSTLTMYSAVTAQPAKKVRPPQRPIVWSSLFDILGRPECDPVRDRDGADAAPCDALFYVTVENIVKLVHPDSVGKPLPLTKPAELFLEAGYRIDDHGTVDTWQVEVSDDLLRSLNPVLFFAVSPEEDSMRIANQQIIDQYSFMLTCPPVLQGRKMALRAKYISPLYGEVVGKWFAFHAYLSCTRQDSINAMGLTTQTWFRARQYSRAMQYADSLIAAGFIDRNIYYWARLAAEQKGDVERALSYLDSMKITFGTPFRYDARGEPDMVDPVKGEALYRQELARYQKMLEEQQQPKN